MPGKPQSNGSIERFNGTLKGLIRKALTYEQSDDWVKMLPKLVENYNNSKHSTTRKTPNEIEKLHAVTKKTAKIRKELDTVSSNIKKRVTNKNEVDGAKFYAGDRVRIKLLPNEKDRGGQTFTSDIFNIEKAIIPKVAYSAPYYFIKGKNKKRYYNNDLLKVVAVENKVNQPKKYEISKIVKPLYHKGKPHLEVFWKGYKQSDNTYEPLKNIIRDAPRLYKAYVKKNNLVWYDHLKKFTMQT